jgi:hypothetical protein
MASTRNDVKRNVIGPTLQALINDLKRGSRVIQGKLSVTPGHDYWWFLEYGTGVTHQDPDGEFIPPGAVAGEAAEGGPYEIAVRDATVLVYMSHGAYRRKKVTEHDGIKPLGFLRTSLFDAQLDLKYDLDKIAKRKGRWKDLPKRDDLVEIVNEVLQFLLTRLEIRTPDDSDPDPYHEGRHPEPLSQAWRVTKAK